MEMGIKTADVKSSHHPKHLSTSFAQKGLNGVKAKWSMMKKMILFQQHFLHLRHRMLLWQEDWTSFQTRPAWDRNNENLFGFNNFNNSAGALV